MKHELFSGRTLLIATKHSKETIIAPLLEKEFGLTCIVASNFDTDTLGTFSGEIERSEDALTTARNKCLLAMEATNCDLAIASEGSFGPHPSAFFVNADDELLLLLDKKNNLEIVSRELSIETNFNGAAIKNQKQLREFALAAGFPAHSLIAKKEIKDFTEIEKGISSWEKLEEVYSYFQNTYGSIYLETDMRAMHNPTRMKVIEKATIKLANKLNSLCPACQSPGFGITDAIKGLPCSLCNFPTRSILSYRYTCQKCAHSQEEKYPNNKFTEDPMHCDNCNP